MQLPHAANKRRPPKWTVEMGQDTTCTQMLIMMMLALLCLAPRKNRLVAILERDLPLSQVLWLLCRKKTAVFSNGLHTHPIYMSYC
eukprot:COSAG02_NODE_19185_length_896_cov_0.713927_2_plen_85_part_01